MKLQITVEGKTYEVDVEVVNEDEAAAQSPYAQYQSAPAPFQPTPYTSSHATEHAAAGAHGGHVYRSPVMGLVIRVLVEPGQSVQANDLLLGLEAMKMETNITAAQAGVVKSVPVTPGDSVKINQILVELEQPQPRPAQT